MYEKYNAYEVGVGGGGGEYTPQVGFGWTNGVALYLLNRTLPYVVIVDDDDSSASAPPPVDPVAIVVAAVTFFVAVAVGYCLYMRHERRKEQKIARAAAATAIAEGGFNVEANPLNEADLEDEHTENMKAMDFIGVDSSVDVELVDKV